MRPIFQFGVLCAVYYIGELIVRLTSLPIPGSVVGLVLMFILLRTRVLRLEHVEKAAMFLIRAMPVMFIPITTAMMVSYGLLSGYVVPFLVVTLVSTIVAFTATGWVAQAVILHRRKHGTPDNDVTGGESGSDGSGGIR